MFIILLTYLKPLTEVDAYVAAHRDYLTQGYEQGLLLASGPRLPRTGGVLLSASDDFSSLKNFFTKDPFMLNGIAQYEYIQFNPVKATPLFYAALNTKIDSIMKLS